MTFNSLAIESHWPQSYLEARGHIVKIHAYVAKSGLWKNGLLAGSGKKIELHYDI